jgi:hypothetical protein
MLISFSCGIVGGVCAQAFAMGSVVSFDFNPAFFASGRPGACVLAPECGRIAVFVPGDPGNQVKAGT